MQLVISFIDVMNRWIGRTVSWLTLIMVLLTSYLVIMRYVFSVNSIALQDVVSYLNATVAMLGTAYVLGINGHVRVDILYRNFSPKGKAVADIFGTLFLLLPFMVLFLYFSWGYAGNSWKYHEGSSQAGGLGYVYLLKSLLPAFAILMIVQGIAELLRNILVLMGKRPAARRA